MKSEMAAQGSEDREELVTAAAQGTEEREANQLGPIGHAGLNPSCCFPNYR